MTTASPEVDVRPIEAVETESLVKPESTDGAKDDNLRHIVRPADNEHIFPFVMTGKYPTGQDIVDIAMVRKIEIIALCGHQWVPSKSIEGRDTCNACIEVAGLIRSGG
jgi:hypothetical protein